MSKALIIWYNLSAMQSQIPFNPGDVVRVFQKIREGEKTRTQVFEGTVLSIKGRGDNKTFMARKVVDGVAIERIWPMKSLNIEKIVIKSHPRKRIKKAKLFHLRKHI